MEVWQGIQWPGSTVVILASGPSMTPAMCEQVCEWRERDSLMHRVIAINTTFRLALWADVLYACDVSWWEAYQFEASTTFRGDLWTQDRKARDRFGVRWIESAPGVGLSTTPGLIHQGMNSGFQAINLAYQAGAKKIVLLGYDMQGAHWHGKHPMPLTNTTPELFRRYIDRYLRLAADLMPIGVEVINCTPGSVLTAFPKGELTEVLA